MREVRAERKAVLQLLDSPRVKGRNREVNVGDSNREGHCDYPTCDSVLTYLAQCPAGNNKCWEMYHKWMFDGMLLGWSL